MSELITLNGIDVAGEYARPPRSLTDLAAVAFGSLPDAEEAEEREEVHRGDEPTFGVRYGVDPADLADAGWAVVFPRDADPAALEALAPLLELRRSQAGDRFVCVGGPAGVGPRESKRQFLQRLGAAPTGRADPPKFPYYVLLAGSPEQISYRFQYQLDVQYAVGRIDLATPAEYRAYADAVVRHEASPGTAAPRFAAFGPANPGDPATEMSAADLVTPLAEHVAKADPGVVVDHVPPEEATKAALLDRLGGAARPDLLFTAGHGMVLDFGDPELHELQGALVTQEWRGPGTAVLPGHRVAASDIEDTADLNGLISFNFACFGVGTPRLDSFSREEEVKLAPSPFTSALPRRLLGHRGGAALAVLGHVDLAWSYSFRWPGRPARQTGTFEEVVERILGGEPVGLALESMNEQAAELTVEMSDLERRERLGYGVKPAEVVNVFTAMHDARNFTVFGDPAVRLQREAPK